jgi:hypothetical protein
MSKYRTKRNLLGMKFGKLTVIAESESEKRKDGHGTFSRWICKCDCGKQICVRSNCLVSDNTRSCGCLKLETKNRIYRSKYPKSYGGFLRVYIGYKFGAVNKNREFSLTQDNFKEITQKDCHYCGSPPSKLMTTGNPYTDFIYNGIDRKINSIGYVYENCLPCCEICNKAKGTRTYEEYIEWMNRIADRVISNRKKTGHTV